MLPVGIVGHSDAGRGDAVRTDRREVQNHGRALVCPGSRFGRHERGHSRALAFVSWLDMVQELVQPQEGVDAH